jgi:hypothetical protein
VALDGQESLEAIRQRTEERLPDSEKPADKALERKEPLIENHELVKKRASDLEKSPGTAQITQESSNENQGQVEESASDSEKFLDKERSDARAHYLAALKVLLESRTEFPAPTIFSSQTDIIARLINITAKIDRAENAEVLYQQAEIAVSLLKNHANSCNTAALVLDDIDFSTSRNSPVYLVVRGLAWSVLFLFVGFVVVLGILSLLWSLSSGQTWAVTVAGPIFSFISTPIIISAVFGVQGAIVSILMRLSDFEHDSRRSRPLLKMTGIMLPLVGAIFACVTCALFASGLINFGFATGELRPIDNAYFYVVLGFLSGFSERFTRGLLGSAEAIITAQSDKQLLSTTQGTAVRATETIIKAQ